VNLHQKKTLNSYCTIKREFYMLSRFIALLMITLAVLTLSVYTSGYCQMLVWGKHGEPKITYNVYQGLQSRDYSITTFVGSDTSYKIKQNDVFFAVTAIDSAKNESQFSDEVFYSSNKPIPPYFDINANTDTVT